MAAIGAPLPDFPAPVYSVYEDARHRWLDTTFAKEHFNGPRPAGMPSHADNGTQRVEPVCLVPRSATISA
jgi:hypothetical protein